ncbi:MAG: hypothetical protein ACI9FB_002197 [Candidatus Azotimanducaceae bacterium]|jgi:hypothetical protein
MHILFSVLLALVGTFFLLRLILGKSKLDIKQFFFIYSLVITAIALIFLGLTGKLHWLFVLFGGLLPFLSFSARNAFGLIRLASFLKSASSFNPASFFSKKKPDNAKPQTSNIITEYLDMTLDHGSGDLDGKILKGKYKSQVLSSMDYLTLQDLHHTCSDDEESTRLLNAYLERKFPDEHSANGSEEQQSHSSNSDSIDRGQALAILGLKPDATNDEITTAHRRLIQKMHPDRGGSTYLAARINEAKSYLLRG